MQHHSLHGENCKTNVLILCWLLWASGRLVLKLWIFQCYIFVLWKWKIIVLLCMWYVIYLTVCSTFAENIFILCSLNITGQNDWPTKGMFRQTVILAKHFHWLAVILTPIRWRILFWNIINSVFFGTFKVKS